MDVLRERAPRQRTARAGRDLALKEGSLICDKSNDVLANVVFDEQSPLALYGGGWEGVMGRELLSDGFGNFLFSILGTTLYSSLN